MSPDEIFAAQMWPWPDPIIKRDSMGRVLFVNAAFLQLYGGAVENWRGNVITGWMVPQAPGVPYRFETRLAGEAGDTVFDWIEYSLADGTALAIARNVTALMPSQTPPPAVQAPVEDAVSEAPALQAPAAAQAYEPAMEAPVSQAEVQETVYEAPQNNQHNNADIAAAGVEDLINEAINEPAQEEKPVEVTPIFETVAEEPATVEPTAMIEPAQAPEPEPEPESVPAPVVEPVAEAEPRREVERRALPIENGDAVLGNNWRDAVIAKAVGAENAPQEAAVEIQSEGDQPAPATAPSASDDSPLRILLAEDNAINALLTRTLLEAEGHIVDVVEDGALAVDAAKAQHYDLVFMDMRMPNMDGLESTRKIRALDNRSKSLPIIALTANAFDDDRNACFDSGMNDFMTKPVSAEELSEMVRTWTKSREQRMAS